MIGLDLAKNVFQVHGVDAEGGVVLRKRLRRGQVERFFAGLAPAVVGMEACGGAHHWARLLRELGHEVRLMAIPGVGPIVASAVLATVPDAKAFRSGRGFAAWLGLTPRQNNSAGQRRSGGISKQGQRSLRTLLILGASTHLRHERVRPRDPWRAGLLARRPVKVAAVARAAKTARILWALLAKDQDYRASGAPAA
jgi:transposase